jgi:hypothetical protein
MPIPLYGFLEGDTIGLLMLAYETETVAELAEKLQKSASVRVAHKPTVQVLYKGRALDPALRIAEAGLEPLERFDVVTDAR